MSYRIAGIDVHKKMLAVVVSDVEIESEYQFERRMFGSSPEQLRSLAAWLLEQVPFRRGLEFSSPFHSMRFVVRKPTPQRTGADSLSQ
jgi:hypothetical protein